jgi:hypothetical protein
VHTLRLGCTLWVYNLTGAPISLRQSVDDPLLLRDAELKMEEDEVGGLPTWFCIRQRNLWCRFCVRWGVCSRGKLFGGLVMTRNGRGGAGLP